MEIPAMAPWVMMWLLAFGIYAAGKAASLAAGRLAGVPMSRKAAYLLLFPGMDAAGFFAWRGPRRRVVVRGTAYILNACTGAALLWGVARWVPPEHPLVRGWIGMIGLVMVLHFGLLQLVTLAWRRHGREVPLLMNEPWRAKSVMEFWSLRWNTAYRELSHRFVYQPVAKRLGARAGAMAAFVVSGAVHELVISVPARGGYGLPMAYFLVQAIGVLAERSVLGRRVLGHGMGRRVFAAAVVVGPVAMLFHVAFVLRVFVPFMGAIGALPREVMR